MSVLVTVPEFREWAGISDAVSDDVLAVSLDEAEAAIAADVGVPVADMIASADAVAVARGEELRRANRLLARKNSPEGIAGAGLEGIITLPSRDPDSQRAVWVIQAILDVPQGVA